MEKTLKMTNVLAAGLLGKDAAIDALIKANFTEKELSVSIMDRIKDLADALEYNGETLDQFNKRTEHDEDHEKAYKELCVIALALNEGKRMDYSNTNVYKYYPYFYAAGSGSGFSCTGFSCAYDFSAVGSRLCVNTSEKATYMGKQFIEIYNRYING